MEEMHKFHCPYCGKTFQHKKKQSPKMKRCFSCGGSFSLAGTEESSDDSGNTKAVSEKVIVSKKPTKRGQSLIGFVIGAVIGGGLGAFFIPHPLWVFVVAIFCGLVGFFAEYESVSREIELPVLQYLFALIAVLLIVDGIGSVFWGMRYVNLPYPQNQELMYPPFSSGAWFKMFFECALACVFIWAYRKTAKI